MNEEYPNQEGNSERLYGKPIVIAAARRSNGCFAAPRSPASLLMAFRRSPRRKGSVGSESQKRG